MADARKPKSERDLKRAKLAIIVGLAVVFFFVVYRQYFAGDDTTQPAVAGRESPAQSSTPTKGKPGTTTDLATPLASDKKEMTASGKKSVPWKPMPLKVALQYDPFATPPMFPQVIAQSRDSAKPLTKEELAAATRADVEASSASVRKDLSELQRRGVKVVIEWQDRYYALIDDKLIEVGDEIDGFKIVRISADGVDVEKELPR